MQPKPQTTILLRLLTVMLLLPKDAEGNITCTAFTTTQQTTVTCYFGQDISHHSFNVQFYYPDLKAEAELTLMCNRPTGGGDLMCYKATGVVFNESQEIKDHFILTSPQSLNKVKEGKYRCEAAPHLGRTVEPCTLKYMELQTTTQQSLKSTDVSRHDATYIFLVIVVVLFLILIISGAVIAVIVYKKRASITKWWTDRCIRNLWSAANEGRTGEKKDDHHCARIPIGVPAYFYNKGWRDAVKENEEEARTGKAAGSGESTELISEREEAGRDAEKDETQKKMRRSTAMDRVGSRGQTSLKTEARDFASPKFPTRDEKEEFHDARLDAFPMQYLGPLSPLLTGEQSQQEHSSEQQTRDETKEEKKKREKAEKKKA